MGTGPRAGEPDSDSAQPPRPRTPRHSVTVTVRFGEAAASQLHRQVPETVHEYSLDPLIKGFKKIFPDSFVKLEPYKQRDTIFL